MTHLVHERRNETPTCQSRVFSFSPFSPSVFSLPDNILNQKHHSIHSAYVIYEIVFQKYSFEAIKS